MCKRSLLCASGQRATNMLAFWAKLAAAPCNSSCRWWLRGSMLGCVISVAGCNTAQLYEGGGDYRYIGASNGVAIAPTRRVSGSDGSSQRALGQPTEPAQPNSKFVEPADSGRLSPLANPHALQSRVESARTPFVAAPVQVDRPTFSKEGENSTSKEWFADWIDKYQKQADRGAMVDKFQKGDTISIYLKSAMFSYITEGRLKRTLAEHFRKSGKVAGQIAIIANVSTDHSLAPLVSPAEASNPGRVIFYSGDVEENQTINQSFGPVYGPIKWDGGPIMLDVTVVEIDEEERKQTGAVISSLAKLGTAPGINASPVSLALLNTLGSALVQSNRDDVMGRFRLLLTPDMQSSAYLPTLKEGDLVLIRKSKRDFGYPWRQDCSHKPPHQQTRNGSMSSECDWYSSYNPGTGQFAPRNDDGNKTNYIVFTFVRNMAGPDLTPSTTTAQLLEKIKNSSPNDLTSSIEELVTAKKKEAAGKGLQERLSKLADTGTTTLYRKHVAQEISLAAQCMLIQSSADAEADATIKVARIATEKYCRTKETYNTAFTVADFDMLMRRIGEICERTPGAKVVTDAGSAFTRSALIGSTAVDFSTLEGVMRTKSDVAATKLAECGVPS